MRMSKLAGELLERQRLLSEEMQQLRTSIHNLQAQINTLRIEMETLKRDQTRSQTVGESHGGPVHHG